MVNTSNILQDFFFHTYIFEKIKLLESIFRIYFLPTLLSAYDIQIIFKELST